MTDTQRINKAIDLAIRYGGIDGDHHKAWVIDQMVRALAGPKYKKVVKDACAPSRSGKLFFTGAARRPSVPVASAILSKPALESKLEVFLKQPGAYVGGDEREFIKLMREFAARGVGYGFMQQVIEWEWQAKSEVGLAGAWGPEYFQKRISELEKQVIALRKKR